MLVAHGDTHCTAWFACRYLPLLLPSYFRQTSDIPESADLSAQRAIRNSPRESMQSTLSGKPRCTVEIARMSGV
jgi:hypothetical protein